MLARVRSSALIGLEAVPVTVEVDLATGLPRFTIVGLPDAAIREARDRVRTALKNAGYEFPRHRITVNLAPAHLKKAGPNFDLAMAIGILVAMDEVPQEPLETTLFCGELGLDGSVQAIQGLFPHLLIARRGETVFIPEANRAEAIVVDGARIILCRHLLELVAHLKGLKPIPLTTPVPTDGQEASLPDLAEVKGQLQAKRGLEIAAAGGHNLLMVGPPGAGKTMLAQRLPSILPPLERHAAIDVTKIHSILGLLREPRLIAHPPFRAPHHTISYAAMVGGGHQPRAGEITLAHHGVLFLDELPEFRRDVLEALRQPLESGDITVARAQHQLYCPARFALIAAMNPCPCGYLGHPRRACRCSTTEIRRYWRKISGPLLDRIDLHLEVAPLAEPDMLRAAPGESSKAVQARVLAARALQAKHYADEPFKTNAQLPPRELTRFCPLSDEAQRLLRQALSELTLSARAHDRILKVARTIADLAGSDVIHPPHLTEAIRFRLLDRLPWL